jgi:ribosomal-protein-alanine N-acetyltransferase
VSAPPRTPADVRIRGAVASDLPAVAAIERHAFSDPWSRRAFAELLARPDVHFVVAVRADGAGPAGAAVLGYAVAWFVVPEGELANIAVHPDGRGRGVGASLLDDVLRTAQSRAVTTVFLEVRESNAPARSLYASRGFHLVGRRRNYYRAPVEDALLLRRELAHGGA